METLLQTEGVDVAYGKRRILHKISMNLSRGEKVLLIGPNGAGKTTLLKTVIGLLSPGNGAVNYLGEDITHASVRTRVRKGISYLLQTENIVPGLTVEENLALGGYFLTREELEKQMNMVLDAMEFLKPKLKTRAGLMSGGERQGLALSMVLMRNPKVLLLDEPSAGLAPKAAKKIIERLDKIQATFQVEMVCMVEHNLKLALKWATEVILLVQGRVVLVSDSPQDFVQKPEELEKYFFGV
ncbi:MAG: ATP-binding cassette domain-containing protein [Desulfobacteraceae bacterium]|nr:ATP-binding cassette domain-containing protein [Desulfobacteraceae bacterium]MBC2720528.1 ATP-binding cassette domain-containing protein [Desulfobacteraceae bacterium]